MCFFAVYLWGDDIRKIAPKYKRSLEIVGPYNPAPLRICELVKKVIGFWMVTTPPLPAHQFLPPMLDSRWRHWPYQY